jgi:hypothetical protein
VVKTFLVEGQIYRSIYASDEKPFDCGGGRSAPNYRRVDGKWEATWDHQTWELVAKNGLGHGTTLMNNRVDAGLLVPWRPKYEWVGGFEWVGTPPAPPEINPDVEYPDGFVCFECADDYRQYVLHKIASGVVADNADGATWSHPADRFGVTKHRVYPWPMPQEDIERHVAEHRHERLLRELLLR